MVTPGSTRKVWWKCAHGHSYSTSPSCRKRGDGCPVCAGKQVIPGVNDLKSQRPVLMQHWHWQKNHDINPATLYQRSTKHVWWICDCGKEFRASVARATGKCSSCTLMRVHNGINDIATVKPEFLESWDYQRNYPLTPDHIAANSVQKVWWKCACGAEFQKAPAKHNGKCPVCNQYHVVSGINDIATTHPHLLETWAFKENAVQPTQVSANSRYIAAWKCPHGHVHYKSIMQYLRSPNCKLCAMEQNRKYHKKRACMVRRKDGTTVCYDSIKEASTAEGYCVSTISRYCNNQRVAKNNEQWSWL